MAFKAYLKIILSASAKSKVISNSLTTVCKFPKSSKAVSSSYLLKVEKESLNRVEESHEKFLVVFHVGQSAGGHFIPGAGKVTSCSMWALQFAGHTDSPAGGIALKVWFAKLGTKTHM